MNATPRTRRQRYTALATAAVFAVVATAVWVAGAHGLTVLLVVWGSVVTVHVLRGRASRRATRPAPPRPPRRRRRDGIFSDQPTPDLTPAELKAGERAAHRAAFRAKGSWTLTKRRSYGLYRGDAGDRFLDWPRWRAAYLSEYQKEGPLDPGSRNPGAGAAGSGYFE